MRTWERNRNVIKDSRYVLQQRIIRMICSELNLVVLYPNYHADKRDNNTVIIYTQEGHQYNKTLSKWASVDEERGRICSFENTDSNGLFNLNWLNHGKFYGNSDDLKQQLETFIKTSLENKSIEQM